MSLTELKCTKQAWITLAKTALTAHCRDHADCIGCVLAVAQEHQANIAHGQVSQANDCQSRQLLRAEITDDV